VSTFAAVVLFIGVIAYAVLGGADYGVGFWDLTAGGAARGQSPRRLMDEVLSPVWEANHVWLIFCLVMLWTAFPPAFAAIMTTLYVPLGLAALGIVIRGSGFAFRSVMVRTDQQRVAGAAFAVSSILVPFFFGTVAGAIASGRVPTAGNGDAVRSWVNPTSFVGGFFAVLMTAFVGAVFLTAEARHRGEPGLTPWFARRARLAAAGCGAVALAGIGVLRTDSPRLFHELLTRGLVLVVLSTCFGVVTLFLLQRLPTRVLQGLGAGAAATIVLGWGIGQYPYLLGTHLPIAAAAAPDATLFALTVVAAVALVVVAPSMGLLFVLQQRGRLGESS
jgi:cytochrome d ubiquinol oxidase subunit II